MLRLLPAFAVAIVLLSLLYTAQVIIARGYQGPGQSLEIFARATFEWTAWAILLPAILWLARRFPVGPGRPARNLSVIVAGAIIAMPAWAVLVGLPVSLLQLPLWGNRGPGGFLAAAQAGLLQRGAYLVIVYGLIVGLTTARRLAEERQAAIIGTAEARRELAAADLAQFTSVMGSERLVDQLEEVEAAMRRSVDEAEIATLALAGQLHGALLRSRELLRG